MRTRSFLHIHLDNVQNNHVVSKIFKVYFAIESVVALDLLSCSYQGLNGFLAEKQLLILS